MRTAFCLSLLVWLVGCASGHENSANGVVTTVAVDDVDVADYKSDDSFDVADITTDKKLSSMRGGFVTVGGLTFNFGLISTASINGVIQSTINLSTQNLNGKLPTNITQLLQTGSQNSIVVPNNISPTVVSNLSNNILTVVQNTDNNKVIQLNNVLNINITNFNTIRGQIAANNALFALHHH